MKKILLFDTAEGSDNVGDNIIMDYCQHQLEDIFNDQLCWFDKVPTHLEIGKGAFGRNKHADYSFVCGTNILKTTVLRRKIWKIGLHEALNLKNLILMGVGWCSYNKLNSDPYTKLIYRLMFNKKFVHSVRDEYTRRKLNSIGITNVVNTACPTMWNLTKEHCRAIPSRKSNQVVTAITHYIPDMDRDKYMFDVLHKNYKKIYLWMQQKNDYEYFKKLNIPYNVEILSPLVSKFDNLLQMNEIDFIGSRLHGGIRALNYGRRTIIIGIDNRAIEINRDTNLPVINRNQIESLDDWINSDIPTEIILPIDNINSWKEQFK